MTVVVSCVNPILNASFCVIWHLFLFVEDAKVDHMDEAYSCVGRITAL